MNHQLCYLALLCQQKNDLNRRRRRFHALRPKTKWLGYDANQKPMYAEYAPHRAYTLEEIYAGYTKAQSDMKAMTKHMRAVQKLAGATLHWGDSGQIQAIVLNGEGYYRDRCIYPKQWARLIDLYKADDILLG